MDAFQTVPAIFYGYLFSHYNSIKPIKKLSRLHFKNSFDSSEVQVVFNFSIHFNFLLKILLIQIFKCLGPPSFHDKHY